MQSLRRLPTTELIRRAWLEICKFLNNWFDNLFSDVFSFYQYGEPSKKSAPELVDASKRTGPTSVLDNAPENVTPPSRGKPHLTVVR